MDGPGLLLDPEQGKEFIERVAECLAIVREWRHEALNDERTELPSMYGTLSFVGPEDVLYPIPQNQIDLMGALMGLVV